MAVNFYNTPNGGDDRKILAYALFYGYGYEKGLGVEELVASADSTQELKDLPQVANCEDLFEWQIIDTSTFKITDSGNKEEIVVKDGVDLFEEKMKEYQTTPLS